MFYLPSTPKIGKGFIALDTNTFRDFMMNRTFVMMLALFALVALTCQRWVQICKKNSDVFESICITSSQENLTLQMPRAFGQSTLSGRVCS